MLGGTGAVVSATEFKGRNGRRSCDFDVTCRVELLKSC